MVTNHKLTDSQARPMKYKFTGQFFAVLKITFLILPFLLQDLCLKCWYNQTISNTAEQWWQTFGTRATAGTQSSLCWQAS